MTLKPIGKTCGIPDNFVASICLRAYQKGYKGYIRRPFTIPLEDDKKTYYWVHPQRWPRVDIAVVPVDLQMPYESEFVDGEGNEVNLPSSMQSRANGVGLDFDVECIQDFEKPLAQFGGNLSETLLITDEIFIVGYPKGITDLYGQPIWKRATVATQPSLGFEKQHKFLVDCASRDGMSGAPALYFSKSGRLQIGGTTYLGGAPIAILHGIYASRIGTVDEFEAQIGAVWKRQLIDEIIDAKVSPPISAELILHGCRIVTAIEKCWPKQGENYATKLLGPGILINYFVSKVLEEINGRANPDDVKAKVTEFAKAKLVT